jgi:hypothetical protein
VIGVADGVHGLGGAVVPAAQLSVTKLEYPLTALNFPLKVAVCVGKTVSVGFVTVS